MDSLGKYLGKRGITNAQMEEARNGTREMIEAYKLREARKACNLTQVELARAMGVSQNRVSRMENGDIKTMSLESIRRYIEAVGGTLTLIAELPTGTVKLT